MARGRDKKLKKKNTNNPDYFISFAIKKRGEFKIKINSDKAIDLIKKISGMNSCYGGFIG